MKNQFIFVIISVIIVFVSILYFGINTYSKFKAKKYPVQPNIELGVLYKQDFSFWRPLKDWNAIDISNAQDSPSKWRVVDDDKIEQQSNIFKSDSQKNIEKRLYLGSNFVLEKDHWTNYSIVLKFKTNSSGVVGFLIRYQDEENYYKVSISNNSDLGGPFIRIDKLVDGKLSNLYITKISFKADQDNIIKISIYNNRINVYLNDLSKLTLYGIDKDRSIENGKFGLSVYQMPDISFWNIKIIDSNIVKEQNLDQLNNNKQQDLDDQINQLLDEIGLD